MPKQTIVARANKIGEPDRVPTMARGRQTAEERLEVMQCDFESLERAVVALVAENASLRARIEDIASGKVVFPAMTAEKLTLQRGDGSTYLRAEADDETAALALYAEQDERRPVYEYEAAVVIATHQAFPEQGVAAGASIDLRVREDNVATIYTNSDRTWHRPDQEPPLEPA